jgi:phosphate transport system substrate-binding protein
MQVPRPTQKVSGLRAAPILFCFLISALAIAALGQTTENLSQIKKVYVGSLGDGKGTAEMSARIAERLRASGRVNVMASADQADATIHGIGRIWTTGYTSIGVHPSRANREPVFDGFLSVNLDSKSGATLWSYLVTPSKFSVKRITNDLADQIVQKLLDALQHHTPETQAAAIPSSAEEISIHGAGATFPWPLYQKWFESYEQKAPNTRITYDPVGSESGIQRLSERSVDFAASDMPLSDQAMSQSSARFLHFASVLGAVVPIYNLANISRALNFTPEALAGIYLGTIKKWNDPVLRSSNPGVAFPDAEIVVVHRSDGSGTTFAFTDYLSKVSPQWKARFATPAATISWPAGQGAERNEGVATLVRQTPNSIGYVELIYAIQHELRFGAVRNAAGRYIKADLASVTAAAAGVGGSNSDFRFSITNASGKEAYPIATFTWLLLPAQTDSSQGAELSAKRLAVIEFLRWALTSGQKECSSLGYAPLPAAVANQELQALTTSK